MKPNVVKSDNVGMSQRGCQLCLALEALQKRFVGAQGLGHHLDGHVSPKAGDLGPVYLSHAARPEQSHHLVRADPSARCQTHAWSLAQGRPTKPRRYGARWRAKRFV